jgi:hypothetical protein
MQNVKLQSNNATQQRGSAKWEFIKQQYEMWINKAVMRNAKLQTSSAKLQGRNAKCETTKK